MITILFCVATIVAASVLVGHLTEKDANKRVRLERERCARLALSVRTPGLNTVERMVAVHHGQRISAAILGIEAPARRNEPTTVET